MKVFTVTQLNRVIKDLIDNEVILEDIIVTGELSSFSITRNIAYFTLKENDNLLLCIKFDCTKTFNIGDLVQCRGNVKYYPKGGKLSFTALSIELCGQGELFQQFLRLKEKLTKEGLFDESNKIPLPRYISSIGVVTSKTGAVLQDIRNIAFRRNPNLQIFVYDAQVQGKFAVRDVIEGITYFDNMTDVDVIVVARGGGNIEDLMPFNDEELARIAYICNKPIISAVGHETDFSILDFVADLRAPTPSAAAEIVAFDNIQLISDIKSLVEGLTLKINAIIENLQSKIHLLISDIEGAITLTISDKQKDILYQVNLCEMAITKLFNDCQYKIGVSINTIDKLNPIKLLKSGYSCATINGKTLTSKNTKVGDVFNLRTSDTLIKAQILSKEKV